MDATVIPGIDPIKAKLAQIDEALGIEDVRYDTGRMTYTVVLRLRGRTAEVTFSQEFLEDLRDNPSGPTSKYSQELDGKLTTTLLEVIERKGLIAYSEGTLKYLLLKYVYQATQSTPHVHKYNTIGKVGSGDFERWLGVSLSEDERQTLIWAWDELRRLRLIMPTGKDLVEPDNWVRLTDKGVAAIEGKGYVEFSEGEHFINKGEVYTAYQKIKSIMKQSREELLVIDPHVNAEVLDLFSTIDATIRIRLITNRAHGDFVTALTKLRAERGNLEVRRSDHFHDRFIVVDRQACYQLGGSIMDAGSKAMIIDRKEDATRDRVLLESEKLWGAAQAID